MFPAVQYNFSQHQMNVKAFLLDMPKLSGDCSLLVAAPSGHQWKQDVVKNGMVVPLPAHWVTWPAIVDGLINLLHVGYSVSFVSLGVCEPL
jgi:hypothetical protein